MSRRLCHWRARKAKHLKVLENARLVTRGRDAQRRPCRLEPNVFDLMTKWIEKYRQRAEERYRRLDTVLAAMDSAGTDDGQTTRHRHQGAAS